MALWTQPIRIYSQARALHFHLQSQILETLAGALVRGYRRPQRLSLSEFRQVRQAALDLIEQDRLSIEQGVYPPEVLLPESPVAHWGRMPSLIRDSLRIGSRRVRRRTTEFDDSVMELLDELPRYYRRCFHYQSNGYLSETSAELYEHQVEILFGGMADAMRRLVIPPMKRHFGLQNQGKGLRILEVGAGTARASKFLSMAFPKATIVATDLSPSYLRVAQRRLSRFPRINFLQADGANLPFRSGEFDAVFSVFLFHELPLNARKAVIDESVRVLRPGGFLAAVDSLQTGDVPELDVHLERFPTVFHEPFFRNYVAHPLEDLWRKAGVRRPEVGLGFFSKVIAGALGSRRRRQAR